MMVRRGQDWPGTCCKPGSNLFCQENTADQYVRAVSWRLWVVRKLLAQSKFFWSREEP